MLRASLERFALPALLALALAGPAAAAIDVLTVDCTPFVPTGPTAYGPGRTMGLSLQLVDPSNTLFNVTEVTPATFRSFTAAQLATYDLIAVNNRRDRIDCDGTGLGLGTTWHAAVGVGAGGRVLLVSHDAARFHVIVPPGSTSMGSASGPCPNCEPFGADELVRDAALWAGGGACAPGLLIFNDAFCFDGHPNGGQGWNNPELNFPATWAITDVAEPSCIGDGGRTDILPAFAAHPVYANVTDSRLAPNSISSFAANVGDNSFHSAFGSYEASIFTVTEVMINNGVVDPGGFGCCAMNPGSGIPNGTALTLLRDENCATPAVRRTWGSLKQLYR